MSKSIRTYIHLCTYTLTRANIYVCTHEYIQHSNRHDYLPAKSHVNIFLFKDIYIHMCIHECIHTGRRDGVAKWRCGIVHTYMHMHTYIHMYIYIYIYIYIYAYIYVCVCVYLYAYIHLHKYIYLACSSPSSNFLFQVARRSRTAHARTPPSRRWRRSSPPSSSRTAP